MNGISIIVYTNLDCIDGKQARRTKSSSPLGQLFDHGCDALALHVMLALVQSALSHSSGLLSSITIFAVRQAGRQQGAVPAVACPHLDGCRSFRTPHATAHLHACLLCLFALFLADAISKRMERHPQLAAPRQGPLRPCRKPLHTAQRTAHDASVPYPAPPVRYAVPTVPSVLPACPSARLPPFAGAFAVRQVNLPWLSSHWEEYHTGVLMYGDGYFGVLEANYILALISLISGVFGPWVWATPMARLVPHWPHWAGPNTGEPSWADESRREGTTTTTPPSHPSMAAVPCLPLRQARNPCTHVCLVFVRCSHIERMPEQPARLGWTTVCPPGAFGVPRSPVRAVQRSGTASASLRR